MNKNLKIGLLLAGGLLVAVLVGNKSEHAFDIENKIEQGTTNPSRN